MKEEFFITNIISRQKMKTLLTRSDSPAAYRFIVLVFLFLLINVLVVLCWNESIILIILSQCTFGILCCSLFACEHETVHGTAFKTKALNRICSLVVGFFHLYPPSLFRDLHFTHHRFTHIPGKDPEISFGNKPIPSILINLGTYLSWISGLPVLLFKLFMIAGGGIGIPELLRSKIFPFVNPVNRAKITVECLTFLMGYILFLYLLLTFEPRLIAILSGQVIGHCFLSMYVSAEHNGLPNEGNILNKTRSIKTNKIIKLIMWNMPYHAEHHAFPAVPFYALPLLSNEIDNDLIHKNESHLDFHLTNVKRLINLERIS